MKYYKDISVFLVSFKETLYICCRKNSRIDWIGKLINFYEIPRQASLLNGGPRPSVHHIIGAAFYKERTVFRKERPSFLLVVCPA